MNELLSLLKGIAPTVATMVAGPLGGAAVSALASKFGVSDSVEAVAKAIAGDPQAAQKLAEMELEYYKTEQKAISERWSSDMNSDSWLSKNIRPMSLIAILGGYFVFAMMSAFGYNANESYVTLLGNWGMLIFGAYFGSRSLEKITEMRTKSDK
jgi:hypothetical protein